MKRACLAAGGAPRTQRVGRGVQERLQLGRARSRARLCRLLRRIIPALNQSVASQLPISNHIGLIRCLALIFRHSTQHHAHQDHRDNSYTHPWGEYDIQNRSMQIHSV